MIDILGGTEPSIEWGVGIGAAAFFVSLPMFWAGIHLRGRTDDRLRAKVDLAYAGLAEKAIDALEALRDELDRFLPDASAPFDPQDAFADPATVESAAKRGVAALRMRGMIQTRFLLMLRVATLLKLGTVALTTGVLLTTLTYLLFFALKPLWFSLLIVTLISAAFCVATLVIYERLEARIQASVEAANPIVRGTAT